MVDTNLISEETVMDDNAGVKTDVQQTSPDAPSSAGQAVTAQPPAQANTQVPKLVPVEDSPYTITSSDQYIAGGGLDQDINDFHPSANRFTGYKNLDRIQPFYPGLYVTAAAPGAGKTTAMLQMGYQLAADGTHVIFFSLEQTPLELYSKLLSRKSYMKWTKSNNTNPTYTSMEIRRRLVDTPTLDLLKCECIQDIQGRLHIVQGDFGGTVEDISREVESMAAQLNSADIVVFVDYLQIISPSVVNGRLLDTKSSMDHIVRKLKSLQKKHMIPIVLISSLNRQSYMMPPSLDSCKDSGVIGYAADVIWGLQYDIIYKPEFYHIYDEDKKKKRETNNREKQDMLIKAKSSTIRNLNVSYLKNRFGEDGLITHFGYVPRFDTFIPVDENGNVIY